MKTKMKRCPECGKQGRRTLMKKLYVRKHKPQWESIAHHCPVCGFFEYLTPDGKWKNNV